MLLSDWACHAIVLMVTFWSQAHFSTCPHFIKLGLQVAKCIEIGFPQIILLVIFSQVLVKCLLTFSGVLHLCCTFSFKLVIIRIINSGVIRFQQYIPHAIHSEKPVSDRFAVIFSVTIVWLYAYLLTVGGAYRHSPLKTQLHCRTDRSGLVSGAPW